MIVDCAVYDGEGRRRHGALALEDAFETARDLPDGFVWIGVHEPSEEEFAAVTHEFHLHPLAVEDAIKAHQRPKLERYDETLFVVLKTARYLDASEAVEMGQIMLFLGDRFVITVRHGAACDLSPVRHQVDHDAQLARWGPSAVLHGVVDQVVDQYATVLAGLDVDVDEIELQVFSGDRASHSQRIFKLKREVLEFRSAVAPLVEPLDQLASGKLATVHPGVTSYFRDVHDHVLRAREEVEALDHLLTSALDADVAQVGMRQNEDMRKITAWVAVAAVPTLIAGIFGMNFEHMPELDWTLGYPLALALMVLVAGLLYRTFKGRDWL